MESIKQIFKIGNGPSSSHTMGPLRAAKMFLEKNPSASRFEVTLYGSLAATGKGHMTDAAATATLCASIPFLALGSINYIVDYPSTAFTALCLCLFFNSNLMHKPKGKTINKNRQKPS